MGVGALRAAECPAAVDLPRRRRAHLRQRHRPRRQRQHRPESEEGRFHARRGRQGPGDHGVRFRGGAVGRDSRDRARGAGSADPESRGGAQAGGRAGECHGGPGCHAQAGADRPQESPPCRPAVRCELDAARGARAGDRVRARLHHQAADAGRPRRDCVGRIGAPDRPGLHRRSRDAFGRARSILGGEHRRLSGRHDAHRRRDRRGRIRGRRERVQHLQYRPPPGGHRTAVRRAGADSAEEVDRLLQQRRDAAWRGQPGSASRRHDRAVKANVSIYPVDTRGLTAIVPGGSASQASGRGGSSMFSGRGVSQQFASQAASQDTLVALASDTAERRSSTPTTSEASIRRSSRTRRRIT